MPGLVSCKQLQAATVSLFSDGMYEGPWVKGFGHYALEKCPGTEVTCIDYVRYV